MRPIAGAGAGDAQRGIGDIRFIDLPSTGSVSITLGFAAVGFDGNVDGFARERPDGCGPCYVGARTR